MFDAWDLDEFYRRQVTDLTEVESIEVLDAGPLVGRIRVTRRFRSSRVVQTLELRPGSRRLDVHCEVDWQERDHVLKVAFPLAIHTTEMSREIQFGHVRTPIHTNTSWDEARFEVCAHRWVDVSESRFGVALLNDSKYGYDATRTRSPEDDSTSTTVRLTLLRGAQYPDPFADQGHHEFTYSLFSHAGDLQEGDVVEEGYLLNIAPRVVPAGSGVGAPALIHINNHSVVIETVKLADDGSGDVVVRCYEADGGRTTATITASFEFEAVEVTDVHERPNASIPVVPLTRDHNGVSFPIRPFQIVTLRIRR